LPAASFKRGAGLCPQAAYQPAAYNLTVVASEKTKPQRVLGLDVGARRIGLAVTDPLGITAQGLETLERKNKKQDFAYLNRVLREYDVKEIVVGLPLRMSGEEGTQAGKIRIFAEELGKKFGLPVHLWDERLTSAEANRFLRDSELSIEKRAKAVDRMAAVLILQGWMERNGLNTASSEQDQERSAQR
jgi:putative holliday junction resolvase